MTNKAIRTLVLAALFAALACVATMVIQIPSPMNGYVNLGDCFVLLAGWVLGPVYGSLAAGIGSALADMFTGYMHYAPGTFLIKAVMALIAWALAKALISRFAASARFARAFRPWLRNCLWLSATISTPASCLAKAWVRWALRPASRETSCRARSAQLRQCCSLR